MEVVTLSLVIEESGHDSCDGFRVVGSDGVVRSSVMFDGSQQRYLGTFGRFVRDNNKMLVMFGQINRLCENCFDLTTPMCNEHDSNIDDVYGLVIVYVCEHVATGYKVKILPIIMHDLEDLSADYVYVMFCDLPNNLLACGFHKTLCFVDIDQKIILNQQMLEMNAYDYEVEDEIEENKQNNTNIVKDKSIPSDEYSLYHRTRCAFYDGKVYITSQENLYECDVHNDFKLTMITPSFKFGLLPSDLQNKLLDCEAHQHY